MEVLHGVAMNSWNYFILQLEGSYVT